MTPRWAYATLCGIDAGGLAILAPEDPTWMRWLLVFGAVTTGLLTLAPEDKS